MSYLPLWAMDPPSSHFRKKRNDLYDKPPSQAFSTCVHNTFYFVFMVYAVIQHILCFRVVTQYPWSST